MGELITFGNDSIQGKAYLSQPRLERAPAVLLFHAWWGLNTFIRELADRICDEGFVVLAPDYYQGKVASTIDQAKILKSQMDRSRISALAEEALDNLLGQDYVHSNQVAAIGFSLGCGLVLNLARSKPAAIRSIVLFYGTGGGKFDSVRADILGHFAEDDQWGAHTKKVKSFRERLRASSGSIYFHTYPQTRHWFFESDRADAYNGEAAEVAWNRTIRFLQETLT